jgi:serine/threonine protein phosphatase PrpC
MNDTLARIGVFRTAFRTDAGSVRANNEDLPLVDAERRVCGVIDGVGGHAAGEIAAAIARDVILQRLARPIGSPGERVREAIALANNEIFRRAGESPDLEGMTCVVTLAVISDGALTIGHVGDTRLYKLRGPGMQKLTRDHSPVGEREDAGEIGEADAMRHPRRHEVFRDVGSAYRDKDEDDYVDVLQHPLEQDAAVVLCSDGLTDMLPSAAIQAIVHAHAGDPDAVVDALVRAANEAGGKDNITVVYAEGPEFAASLPARVYAAPGPPTAPRAAVRAGRIRQVGAWIVRSRTTWFAIGALSGVLAALLLVWRIPATGAIGTRTLVVGSPGSGAYTRISDALLAARAGDTVRVEPGLYPERILVPEGVSLLARIPFSVTLARAADTTGEWVALTAVGERGGNISGIQIYSTSALPIDVGIRVAGQSRTVELAELIGPMETGLELLPGSALTVHNSRFAVQGAAVKSGESAEAIVSRSVFLRTGRAAQPPVTVGPSARTTLTDNVFAGYPGEIVKGATAAERQQIGAANVIVTAR